MWLNVGINRYNSLTEHTINSIWQVGENGGSMGQVE